MRLTRRDTGELLSEPTLPPSLIPKCLDVLLKGTSERDFMRIVVEIVQTLRADSSLVTSDEEAGEATDMEEDGEVPRAKVGKKKRGASMGVARVEGRKELDLRCLLIVRALLERVMGVSTDGLIWVE
jgi:condensin complex subunit 3